MAFTLNKNFNGSSVKKINIPAHVQDYVTDWAVSDENTSACEITSIVNSVDKPVTVKLATNKINNVYKNTNIVAANRAPITSGTRFSISYHGVWTETDDTTGETYDAPVACSIACTVPDWAIITPENILELVGECIGHIFETSDTAVTDSVRIKRLLRGAERPLGL